MTWIDRQKQAALAAYRRGYAGGSARRRLGGTVLTVPVPREDPDARALAAAREPLTDGGYRLGHLPTADEQ